MSNIIISPQSGVIEFNTGNAGSSSFMTSTAPIRLDATGGNVWFTGSKVGIGTTNPSAFDNEADRLVIGDGAGAQGMSIFGGTSSNIYFADGTAGSAPYIGYIQYRHSEEKMAFGVAGGRRMTLDGNGYLGIGVTAPVKELQVNGSILGKNNGGFLQYDYQGNIATLLNLTTANELSVGQAAHVDSMSFNVGGTDDAIFIDSSANVGIGTTDPEVKLHVKAADGVTGVLKIEGGKDTVTSVGEINSEIQFGSNDPSVGQDNVGGKISSVTEYNNGAFAGLAFYTYYQTTANLAERVRFTYDGKVGIGLTNPDNMLHVEGADEELARFKSTDNDARIAIQDNTDTVYIGHDASADLMQLGFNSTMGSTDNLSINTAGAVGIGTNNPAYQLDVVNSDGGTLARFKDSDSSHAGLLIQGDVNGGSITNASAFTSEVIYLQNSANAMRFYTDGTEAVRIDSSQRVGIGTNSVNGFTHINGRMLVESPTVPSTLAISDSGDATKNLRLGYEPTWDVGSISASDFGAGWKDIVIAPIAGKVGIGTTAPHQALSVKGTIVSYNSSYVQVAGMTNSSDAGRLYANNAGGVTNVLLDSNGDSYLKGGDVGIGTATPDEKLHVVGDVLIDAGDTNTNSGVLAFTTQYNTAFVRSSYTDPSANTETYLAFHANTAGATNGACAEQMRIAGNNVGIGTTDPDAPLSVKVGSSTTEAKVFELVANDDRVLSILQPDNAQNNDPWTFATNNSYTFRVDAIDALNIDYAGNVGIGTTNPSYQLDVKGDRILLDRGGTNDAVIEAKTATAGAYFFANSYGTGNYAGLQIQGGGSDNWFLGQYGYTDFRIVDGSRGGGTAALVVQNTTRNVGIGSTSPAYKLDVAGDIQAKDSAVIAGLGASDGYIFHDFGVGWGYKGVTSSSRLGIFTDTAERLTIDANGRVGIGSTAPTTTLQVVGTISGVNGQFSEGLFISGAPVLTGENNPAEADTLATVTARGATTTTAVSLNGGASITKAGQDVLTVNRSNAGTAYMAINPSGGDAILKFQTNGTDNFAIGKDGTDTSFRIAEGGALETNPRLIIANGGNVGIGITSAANQKFTVGARSNFDSQNNYYGSWVDGNTAGDSFFAVGQWHNVGGRMQAGSNNMYIHTHNSSHDLVLQSGGGYVGIETNTPAKQLQLGGSNPWLRLEESDSGGNKRLDLWVEGSTGVIGANQSAQTMMFQTVGETRMTIASDGDVGIGTTSPDSDFSIVNTAGIVGMNLKAAADNICYIDFGDSSDNNIGGINYSNTDDTLNFRAGNANRVTITSAGNVGIGTTSPNGKLTISGDNNKFVEIVRTANNNPATLNEFSSYYSLSIKNRLAGSFLNFGGRGEYSDIQATDGAASATAKNIALNPYGGNVGIGTTDPLGTTHIYTADAGGTIATNASHDDLIIENNGNCGIQLSSPASSYQYLAFGDTASANQGYVRYYHSSDRMDLRAGGSDILSLVGSKVGIGTTNPQEELDLRGDMRLDSGGTTDRSIYFRNQSSIAKVRSDAALQFDVGVSSSPSAAMYIQEDTRYVGIGTTGPVAKLEVQTSSLAEIATGLLIHNNVATTSTAGNGVSITMGRAGGVYSSKIANVWTNNNPSYLQTNIAFYTMHDSYAAGSETEKMRLTSQGRLGIGVTNPSQRLEVVTNTDASAQIGRAHIGYVGFADHAGFAHLDNASTSNYSLLQSSAGDTFINSVASRHIYFRDGNTTIGGFNSDDDFYVDTDALYVDVSASRVGINEDSVDATLHMTNVGGGVVNQKFERAGASAWRLGIPNGQTYFAFDDANDDLSTAKVVITKTDGNVGIGLTDPDQKLHVSENIRVGDGGASDYNRIDFTRYGGAVVGGIGWHTDAHFYVAGHPSVGPTAGNTVRVYGFGADVRLGDSVNGDVLTVDATNGNVGIGTTTPYGQVDIFSSNNTETDPDDAANYHLHLHNPLDDTSESIGIGFGLTSAHDAVGAAIAHERKGSNSYGDLYFSTRPDGGSVTERMRINSAGNVGIGSTSPAKTLTVDGSIGGTAFGIADGKGLLVDGSPSDNQYARFTANGLEGRSTANVLSDIGAQATIDASSRLSATLVGANGNVSNTEYGYLNGVTSAIQTQLNDRYTESEIQTFMDHSYISKEGASDLAVGWYTIATNAGNRATARFGIWDTDSSRHQSVTFYAAHKYGNAAADTITVLDTSHYGTSPFRYIRIKAGGTYDGAALQVYIDNAQNALNAAILGDNFQSDSWVLCDFIPDADTPPLVSNYGSFSESSRIDLDEIAQGGFATTGPIYADGNTTQYKVITTNDFGISNTDPVKIDSSSVADNEYARFTANGLESRSTSEVRSDISAMPSAGNSSTEVQFATVTTPVIAFGSLAYYSPTAGKRAFTQLSTDYNYYSIGSTVNSFSAGSTCVPIYGDGSYWRVG